MSKRSKFARALAFLGLAVAAMAPFQPAGAADQVTVVSWGGAAQAAQRKIVFEPFAKASGIKVIDEEYNGELAKIRGMVETKNVSWDVIELGGGPAQQLCADGTLERIDWKKLGLDKSRFLGAEQFECGVPDVFNGTVVAYDKDKLSNGPKSTTDLFDTQRFPGKRGLWKSPSPTLEWALMADGVPLNDIYKVLRTPAGVERAFRKLDTIKKDVVWWTSGAQPPQLLADGQVVMTSAPNGRILDAVKSAGKRFEIVWHGSTLSVGVWGIPKGSPRRDEAYKFIAYAASSKVQAEYAKYYPNGPANRDAAALVDAAMLQNLPTAPANMAHSLVIDNAFWGERGDELRQRFTGWLAK